MHTTQTSTHNIPRLLIPALVAVVLLTLAMPKTARFAYNYRRGAPWEHETLVAQIDFPIYKTEDQILEERLNASQVKVPYYKFSADVAGEAVKRVSDFKLAEQYRYAISEQLRSIYDRGVLYSVPESEIIYIQRGKRAEKYLASEIFTVQSARDSFNASMERQFPAENIDSIFSAAGVLDLIAPNLIYDKETTDLIAETSDYPVSPTSGYVSSGQIIVSEGEIVTAEIEQMLDSYKREYAESVGTNRTELMLWVGSFLISGVLVLLLLLTIFFACPAILSGWRRYSYIITVFTISALTAMLMCRFYSNFICIVPFTMAALYLQAFFKNSEIVPVYAISLLPLLIFAPNGPALYVMFLLAGIVAITFFLRFSRGWRQFVTALATFSVLAAVCLAFWMTDIFTGNILKSLFFLFIGSVLTVACYPLIYLFEKIFNLVSSSRMEELCDTSNPVLHELELKAPGTFQHSLQVMNMADAAARAIGANVQLVRVGALYHDIGKMVNPLCFVENESILTGAKNKYHANLSAIQSAKDIISHVTDGLAIAKKHRLPIIIPHFIQSHHGTTVTSYFWDKHLKEGGSDKQIKDFTYPGPKPSLKEEIILMLCDSIEAASRTLQDYSTEAFDSFVERMVNTKLDAGQFEDSDISIQELRIIKITIKAYLAQMYHARIAYPEETKTNKLRLWKSKQTK